MTRPEVVSRSMMPGRGPGGMRRMRCWSVCGMSGSGRYPVECRPVSQLCLKYVPTLLGTSMD